MLQNIPATETQREENMPNTLYVGLQDEDKIVAFDIDNETGALTRRAAWCG